MRGLKILGSRPKPHPGLDRYVRPLFSASVCKLAVVCLSVGLCCRFHTKRSADSLPPHLSLGFEKFLFFSSVGTQKHGSAARLVAADDSPRRRLGTSALLTHVLVAPGHPLLGSADRSSHACFYQGTGMTGGNPQ